MDCITHLASWLAIILGFWHLFTKTILDHPISLEAFSGCNMFPGMMSASWSTTFLHSVSTCSGVSFTSMHKLNRWLSISPLVNRCLFRGQRPVKIPMTFLISYLSCLIRLRASFFDATGATLLVCLHPSLFFYSVMRLSSVLFLIPF